MPPFLQFLIRRFLLVPISLLIITMVLYAGVMLTPPEARAQLYVPPGKGHLTENFIKTIINKYRLDQPYPVQYGYWITSLLKGDWGYSPTLRDEVLPSLLRRTPATLELSLYSLLLFIPLGLMAGLLAGWRQGGWFDGIFRSLAFFGTSMPPFIFSLILISVFYVSLHWFLIGRISMDYGFEITKGTFRTITGMITVDSLLNGRLDVFVDALRHLAMPVVTLSMYHWATLGRITRSMIIENRDKEYIVAARARGVSDHHLAWRHALRSVLAPSLTGIVLSAASVVTGVFVIEIIFGLNGISEVLVSSLSGVPDAPAALGFAVYSVIMVIGLMFILDVVQAIFDPRIREETLRS